MPIFDLRQAKEKVELNASLEEDCYSYSTKDRLAAIVAARLFFFLLLLVDLLWAIYSFSSMIIHSAVTVATLGRWSLVRESAGKAWINMRRAIACGFALVLALFSPALGIMIACSYFLMYDKAGLEDVVPSSLQARFKQYFKGSQKLKS